MLVDDRSSVCLSAPLCSNTGAAKMDVGKIERVVQYMNGRQSTAVSGEPVSAQRRGVMVKVCCCALAPGCVRADVCFSVFLCFCIWRVFCPLAAVCVCVGVFASRQPGVYRHRDHWSIRRLRRLGHGGEVESLGD